MLSEILADAEAGNPAVAPADAALNKIAGLASKQLRYLRMIAQAEQDLADLNEALKEISERKLPDAMAEAGVSAFKLEDGSEISVKPFYGASITDENRAKCHSWLEENGHAALIKKDVTVNLPRGDAETESALSAALRTLGLGAKTKEGIHQGTLNAFVKEQVQGGAFFPMDLFKVFTGRKAKITEAK